MIAALYVQKNGAYYGLPTVDPWDEERDARLYAGPWPVVAHPPCARWSKLAGLVESRHGIKRNEDGGCFAAALHAVRTYGGVLEHPAFTAAWGFHRLPTPPAEGWLGTLCGGWVAQVDQGHYGHPARKGTWLYVHGTARLPELIAGPAEAKTVVELQASGGARSRTPAAFRDVLLGIAGSVGE